MQPQRSEEELNDRQQMMDTIEGYTGTLEGIEGLTTFALARLLTYIGNTDEYKSPALEKTKSITEKHGNPPLTSGEPPLSKEPVPLSTGPVPLSTGPVPLSSTQPQWAVKLRAK